MRYTNIYFIEIFSKEMILAEVKILKIMSRHLVRLIYKIKLAPIWHLFGTYSINVVSRIYLSPN